MSGKNPYTPRRTDWQVTWNGFDMGQADTVDPKLKLVTKEIKRGSTGDHVLGLWIVGLSGSIQVDARDVSKELLQQMAPWSSGGSLLLMPDGTPSTDPTKPTMDLYSYAQLLTLHPIDMADDQSQDLNLIKATPFEVPAAIKRTGQADDMWAIEFFPFPDRDRLMQTGKIIYGWIGPAGSPP